MIMPTSLFQGLNPEKQQKILDAGLSEFAENGYESSSTNRIVQRAGISKGSLFKYFPSKEDLYFYLLDRITAELNASMKEQTASLSANLFERIQDYSTLEISWYLQHPEKARMILRAFARDDSEIYRKIEARYGNREQKILDWFLQDADPAQFRTEKQKALDLVKWFLKGFNDAFLEKMHKQENADLEAVKKTYQKELSDYLELLKEGIIQ